MRRHRWALGLCVLLTGMAAAQPPADEERYPPAPGLPGQVISQSPTADKDPPKDRTPAAPAPDALLTAPTPGPSGSVIPTEPAPIDTPAATGISPAAAPCTTVGCQPKWSLSLGLGVDWGSLKQWLAFRSHSRQSGHYPSSYRPPLQMWFLCPPAKGGPGPVVGPGCASCAAGMPGPIPETVTPAPMTEERPLPAPAPVGSAPVPPPLAGGIPVGNCKEVDVLTTFQPLAPGLEFTPGVAPMACPTKQIKPTTFKPK